MDEGVIEPHTDKTPDAQAVRLSPAVMHGLLRAGTSGTTRALRHWEPPTVEEIQRALPQYEVTEFIARGGMGAVYKGMQRALNRPVAIKILPPDIVDDEMDYAARFKREAQAMASLSHPNIVAVHEAGTTADRLLYFVMEFISGTDVAGMIAKQRRLEQNEAVRITAAVCAALECAHARGIIHRDIKPSNVLINERGEVKVADFGLAKFSTADGNLTQSTVAVGTPNFVAPEAHIPGIALDARADIYSLGVMLYEMLTGKVPRGPFDPPSSEVLDLDPRLDHIIDKAMQADREKRYASAAEMREALLNCSAPVPDAGKPPHRDGLQSKSATGVSPLHKKSRAALILGIITGASILALGAFFALKKLDGGRAVSPKPPSGVASASAPESTTGAPGGRALPSADAATATKAAPFVNTLGMKFVPVPITGGLSNGKRVLFSVWETRVQDYEVFVTETKREWPVGSISQTPAYPARSVSWEDATAFCVWLTERERKAGKLGANESFRLPTDHEWSCAVGIGDQEDASKTPQEKARKIADVFPWGGTWPPPAGTGNYAGEELQAALVAGKFTHIKSVLTGYRDSYEQVAPVGSFSASSLGLHDLGGNVWEWCADWMHASHKARLLRGGSWDNSEAIHLLSSDRIGTAPDSRTHSSNGFRCVVER